MATLIFTRKNADGVGDFADFDAEILRQELAAALPDVALTINTTPERIEAISPREADRETIIAVVAAHGAAGAAAIRARKAEILAELAALDRFVTREGEEYLAALETLGAAGGVWVERKVARDGKIALRQEYQSL